MKLKTNASALIRSTLDHRAMQAWSSGVYPVNASRANWLHELSLAVAMVKANWITHDIKGYVSVR